MNFLGAHPDDVPPFMREARLAGDVFARAEGLPRRALPKDYATLAKVIWGQFDLNTVSSPLYRQ